MEKSLLILLIAMVFNTAHAACPSDDATFCSQYEKAEQGHASAQYNLGVMYDNGEGVTQDASEAVRWTRKAAEQGDAWAQTNLGWMYANGEGVIQDASEAVRWYRKAAEQGHASAQTNLGVMYANGKGVIEDDSEVVRWTRKAAEQGHASAQYNLGVMYWNGEGFITDEREAFIWYSIAKVNGDKDAANNLRKNNWHLDAAEIKSARREAARRLRAIEQDIEQGKADSAKNVSLDNFSLAEPSKSVNIAEQVFEKSWRSVVVIVNNDGQGSGVIVRPNVVATNCHVVDEGGDISVYKASNRRVDTETSLTAVIRHSDTEQDFCLLEVDGLWGVPATIRKYETLRVGENVYSLGAPQGLDLSLSAGLVSQLRKIDGYQVVQTDAAISPGSSGGGLFDRDGNLVGITTFKFVDENVEGIGFAILADLVFTR